MRTLLYLLLLTVVQNRLPAQAAARAPVVVSAGTTFALSVPDMAASERWYVEKLGLSVIARPPKYGNTAVVILSGGGVTVELLQRDSAKSLSALMPSMKDNADVHGISKVGIVVDDFDNTFAALKARGVEVFMGPWPKRADQPANVLIKDNAGNLIQIVGK